MNLKTKVGLVSVQVRCHENCDFGVCLKTVGNSPNKTMTLTLTQS